MAETVESRAVELEIRGKKRIFDVDDPVLPDWVEENALESGDFPYKKKLKEEDYLEQLEKLQVELVKVQFWLQASGKRVMALFEGRDAGGNTGGQHDDHDRSFRAAAPKRKAATETDEKVPAIRERFDFQRQLCSPAGREQSG